MSTGLSMLKSGTQEGSVCKRVWDPIKCKILGVFSCSMTACVNIAYTASMERLSYAHVRLQRPPSTASASGWQRIIGERPLLLLCRAPEK